MGLIKAALGSAGGVMADQWLEYFYCDALPADVLATKGKKRSSDRSSNKKGFENIISNGSVIAVAEGQCMLIVEQGKVVDICAEPGEYKYDTSTEPSVFTGGFGKGLGDAFRNMGKRFAFGGEAPKDQRVYYFNTKELVGNKYGTPSPVPFRVVDTNIGLDMDIAVSCFGEYSYRITNPLLFYTNLCGNVEDVYRRSDIEAQMKTELLTALQPAFAKISEMGIRYSALPGHTTELADVLNEILSNKWRDLRGIEIVAFGVSSVKAPEEDEQMIKDLQRNAVFRDPGMAAANLAGAQAEAMKSAAANENGAAMAFMGMGMAANAGGMSAGSLYEMAEKQKQAAAAAAPQGNRQTGTPCPQCGAITEGKFCQECGAKIPDKAEGWTCTACGAINKGKFCSECGAKKPAGEPLYRCDKCGWEPEDPKKPPKFCPECGDIFDEGDIVQ